MTDNEKFEMQADLTIEQTRAAMMTFFMCYQQALRHILVKLGPSEAADYHRTLIKALKNADIRMPLNDEAKSMQFVVGMMEGAVEIIDKP